MWDEVYAVDDYVYGTEPNDYLRAMTGMLARDEVLCLAEGEGRNAVHLARHGFSVTAVDSSRVGLAKARDLARKAAVDVTLVQADLVDYQVAACAWDSVVSIFCHLPSGVRRNLHRAVVAGLRPGGTLLLEAYTPRQLEFGTGGPPTADFMMALASLRQELAGLEFSHGRELVRHVHEGTKHVGPGAVVQVFARKPLRG